MFNKRDIFLWTRINISWKKSLIFAPLSKKIPFRDTTKISTKRYSQLLYARSCFIDFRLSCMYGLVCKCACETCSVFYYNETSKIPTSRQVKISIIINIKKTRGLQLSVTFDSEKACLELHMNITSVLLKFDLNIWL